MMIDWRQRMSRTSLKSVSKLIDLANDEKSVEEQFLHDLCRSIELNEEKGWGDLPSKLLENGFAVITIDLRGHGASVYNAKLNKVSWKSLLTWMDSMRRLELISLIRLMKR